MISREGAVEYFVYCLTELKMDTEAIREAHEMAIEALDKQIPFEPEIDHLIMGVGRCKCGVEFLDKNTEYCGNCGQKLRWI